MSEKSHIEGLKKLLRYYEGLAEKAIDQCSDAMLHQRLHSEDNSIATIAKHLHGNMLSRWTDFLTSDGEKEWRNRDDEFVSGKETRAEIEAWIKQGWACVFKAIDPLTDSDLNHIIYIRNEGHTVLEAIHRQLGHYAYHTGQIVTIAKVQLGSKWQSLSIPKGNSKTYNSRKMEEDKGRRHFTDRV